MTTTRENRRESGLRREDLVPQVTKEPCQQMKAWPKMVPFEDKSEIRGNIQ